VTEALFGFLGLLAATLAGLWRERGQRRQQDAKVHAEAKKIVAEAAKLAAETDLAEANAAETVAATVTGLLVVMDKRLRVAEVEQERCRDQSARLQGEVSRLRIDLNVEKERTRQLSARVARLTRELAQAKGTL
jgi:hypothetical protein